MIKQLASKSFKKIHALSWILKIRRRKRSEEKLFKYQLDFSSVIMSSVLITNLFGIGILLHTYPSPKPTLTLTSHLGAKCWLRGGVGGQFPKDV